MVGIGWWGFGPGRFLLPPRITGSMHAMWTIDKLLPFGFVKFLVRVQRPAFGGLSENRLGEGDSPRQFSAGKGLGDAQLLAGQSIVTGVGGRGGKKPERVRHRGDSDKTNRPRRRIDNCVSSSQQSRTGAYQCSRPAGTRVFRRRRRKSIAIVISCAAGQCEGFGQPWRQPGSEKSQMSVPDERRQIVHVVDDDETIQQIIALWLGRRA